MLVEKVDRIDLETLQRGLGNFSDVSGPAVRPRLSALLVEAEAELGRDRNMAAERGESFADQLKIDDPVAPVQALYLGRANTRGDAIVWLPKQKVMISGDAVVAPTPYGFSDLMEPWLATLDRMEKYDFQILIPGHGKVQRDRSYLATLRWSLADIRSQADALAKTNASAEEAAKRFDRTEQRRRFGATDGWTKRWLDSYWLDGMFDVAFKQARNLPVESSTDGGE